MTRATDLLVAGAVGAVLGGILLSGATVRCVGRLLARLTRRGRAQRRLQEALAVERGLWLERP